MDKNDIMQCALFFLIGIPFGAITDALLRRKKSYFGYLKINKSSDEKDIYKLEVDNLDELDHKKFLVLKIVDVTNAQK